MKIEVTSIDTGKTEIMSKKEFFETFGKDEGKEILKGHSPNIVAIELNHDVTLDQIKRVNYSQEFECLKFKKSHGWNNQFAIVLCHLPSNEVTPYATWTYNGNDNNFYHGDYCRTLEAAEESFKNRG